MAHNPDRAAERIAAGQRGLITHLQARYRARLTQRQIEWRVATKRWTRRHPGVYALAGHPQSWAQSLLAAQLATRSDQVRKRRGRHRLEEGHDAAATGASALWLRGIRRLGKPKAHHLLVAHHRSPGMKGVTLQRTRSLTPGDVEVIDGVLTLVVPRLALELCGRLEDTDFVAVLDDLLGSSSAGVREEVHVLAVAMCNGRKGVDRLIALTHPDAAAEFRSWLERHTCGLLAAAGVPAAQWNLEVHDEAGALIGIGDAVWVEQRVVVELDGLRFHRSTQQRRRDLRKDRRLAAEQWCVLRYTWLDVMERPDEVVAEIRAALAARTA